MAKRIRTKDHRQSTAAYAASQPLFKALRNASQCVDDQKADLDTARDTVQKIHVKLPTEVVSKSTEDSHELYMDAIVNAWRTATQSYMDIFEELAAATMAEPSTGRGPAEGHEVFVKMLHSVREAFHTSYERTIPALRLQRLRKIQETRLGNARGGFEDVMGDVSASESEEEQTTEVEGGQGTSVDRRGKEKVVDDRPTNPILLSLLGKKRPSQEVELQQGAQPPPAKAIKLRDGLGMPSNPHAASNGPHKDAEKGGKRAHRRQNIRDKRATRIAQGTGGEVTEAIGAEPKQNDARYEDVSAEVTARLQAKEDAKKGGKKEKKRKRESGESMLGGGANGRAEKPRKKKAKSNEGATVAEDVGQEKARKHSREVDGDEDERRARAGGGGKRRKRANS